jgi:hypothetical protein
MMGAPDGDPVTGRSTRSFQSTFWTVALSATVLGSWLWVVSVRERRWAQMVSDIRELRAGMDAPPLQRIPLNRPILDGNAWDDYLAPIPEGDVSAVEFASRWYLDGRGDSKEVTALISTHGEQIGLVRRAAHRRTCKAPPASAASPLGTTVTAGGFPNARIGVSLCLVQARLSADAGDGIEALELLTDAYLCGRDLVGTRTGGWEEIGIKIMQQALDEVGETLKRRSLERSQLLELERRLSLFDRYALDNTSMLLDSLMRTGEHLLQPSSSRWLDEEGPRWRHLFSRRLQAAALFAGMKDVVRRAMPLETIPWAEARPRLEALLQEVNSDRMLNIASPDLVFPQQSRWIRALLRAYALAAHYLATGDVRGAESPYGGPIHTRLDSEFLHVWTRTDAGQDDPEAPEDFRAITKNLKLRMKLKIPVRR